MTTLGAVVLLVGGPPALPATEVPELTSGEVQLIRALGAGMIVLGVFYLFGLDLHRKPLDRAEPVDQPRAVVR